MDHLDERLFTISDDMRVVVRKHSLHTYILIESNGQVLMFDSLLWKKFKKYFSIIDTEFNLRYNERSGSISD